MDGKFGLTTVGTDGKSGLQQPELPCPIWDSLDLLAGTACALMRVITAPFTNRTHMHNPCHATKVWQADGRASGAMLTPPVELRSNSNRSDWCFLGLTLPLHTRCLATLAYDEPIGQLMWQFLSRCPGKPAPLRWFLRYPWVQVATLGIV